MKHIASPSPNRSAPWACTPSAILLEPAGRNTAPAVALAALKALDIDAEATLVVAPADHVIRDVRKFSQAADVAVSLAQHDKLITFGIVAHAPETGYGYIRRGEGAGPAYPVAQFIEKPPLDLAVQFVATGDYYWNSGMFVFKASRYLSDLRHFAPDILEACRPPSRPPRRIWISCASTRLNSQNAAASRSTTR